MKKSSLLFAIIILIALLSTACGATLSPAAETKADPTATPVVPTATPTPMPTATATATKAPAAQEPCNAFKENEQAPDTDKPRTGKDMTIGSPHHRQIVNVWLAPDKKEVSIVLPAMPTKHEELHGVYGHLWQFPVDTGCDSENLFYNAVRYAQEKGRDHHTGLVMTLEEYLKYASGKPYTALVPDAFAVKLSEFKPTDPTK